MDLLEQMSIPNPQTAIYIFPPSSAYPRHVIKAIPFGVVTRLRRNCSHEEFFVKRLEEYKGYLGNQGYLQSLVSEQSTKASYIPKVDLLKPRKKKDGRPFSFVVTFSPNLPNVNTIIEKHLHLLKSCPKLKKLFPQNSIITSFRRSKNLKRS